MVDNAGIKEILREVSPETNIYRKVFALMKRVGSVVKDKSNTSQNYKYVSAEAISSKIQEGMLELGLISTQETELVDSSNVKIRDREYTSVVIKVTLHIYDIDTGAYVTTSGMGSGMDSGDKAAMKAGTAAHKYALIHWLNIPIGDDPEADEEIDKATGFQAPATPARSAPPAASAWPADFNDDIPPVEGTFQNDDVPKCDCGLPARLYVDRKDADKSKWWAKYYCPKGKFDKGKCDFKFTPSKDMMAKILWGK